MAWRSQAPPYGVWGPGSVPLLPAVCIGETPFKVTEEQRREEVTEAAGSLAGF